jgi:hypothetical protein
MEIAISVVINYLIMLIFLYIYVPALESIIKLLIVCIMSSITINLTICDVF